MTLPPRAVFSLNEFCDRLDCSHADVAAWSIVGLFSIFTGISPVLCGLQPVAGLSLKFQVQHPRPSGHRMLQWTNDTSTSTARNVA